MPGISTRAGSCLLIVAAAALGLAVGCNDETAAPDRAPVPAFVGELACKGDGAGGKDETPLQECVVWTYDPDTRLLSIVHRNACLNCCPDNPPYAVWDEGGLTLVEAQTGGLCDCLCLFDPAYEVADVPPATVAVTVLGACPQTGGEVLHGELDLAAQAGGSFCLERTGYPW